MSRWSEEQVLAAAPDSSSIAAGKKLAVPGPWSETGANETLVWGKCQGSGKTPYQVSVDVEAPAYRCSCPSTNGSTFFNKVSRLYSPGTSCWYTGSLVPLSRSIT